MPRLPGKILLPLALVAAPAAAQLSGYSVAGSLAEPRQNARDLVMRAYQDARWQVGFLHLEPRLAIGDLGYISNIYSSAEAEAESDLKAQGAAGLRGFFNLGPKVLVSPFADLGYSWWREQTELRSSHESFGLQLFGDFNRLQLDLQGGRVETQRNLSSELETPVDVRTDRLEANLDIDFWGPFSFFATATQGKTRQSGAAAEERLPGLDLSLLDVDSERLYAGFAYELGNGLSVGLGWEEGEATFANDPGGRSNRGSGPLVRIGLDGTRLGIDVEVARRDLEFDARAPGDRRSQTIGLGRVEVQLGDRLTGSLYGASRLEASALDSAAIFEGRRSGLGLQRELGERTRLGAFYEIGEDEFATAASDRVTRVDDVASYGLSLVLRFGGRVTVELGFLDSRRESTDPEFDRELRSLTSRIRVGGNLLPW